MRRSYKYNSMFKNIIKRFSWKYHEFRMWWPVWFYIINREPRNKWVAYKSSAHLSAVQKRILEDLQKDGIAVTHLDELFGSNDVSRRLLAYTNILMANPSNQQKIVAHEEEKHTAKSDIIVHLLGGYGDTKPEVSLGDSFLQTSLSKDVLDVVASYLEMIPLFKMCSFHSTILLPIGSRALFSQKWHRDPDDKKLVKVFMYMSDVNEEGAGPFTYIKGSQLGGRWRHLFPQVPPVGSYPPAAELERAISKADHKVCLGRAGTMIFCDTSGLHKGGYSTIKRRLMYAATFASRASVLPTNYTLTDTENRDNLSKIGQMTLRA